MLTELERHQVFAYDGDGSIGFAHYDENEDWHDLIPMQYTGLKDKNGVDIYEGDIVKPRNHTGNWIGVVKYNMCSFWIYEVAGDPSGEESTWSGSIKCEIIGNIHENPELL